METEIDVTGAGIERGSSPPNGPAMAAFLAAGIGAFAMGLFVLIHELGLFSAPSLYAPAGGVSGRTTCAVAVWLVAWAVLHGRWKERYVPPGTVFALALSLIALGILGTFPPVWSVL